MVLGSSPVAVIIIIVIIIIIIIIIASKICNKKLIKDDKYFASETAKN